MAPPVAAYLSAFFALITAVSAATSSGYHNYTVGGAAGWLFNSTTNTAATNYSSWASAQTFNLGDFLIFNTNSNQTVVQTYNETLYQSCTADDSDNGTSIYDGGSSSFGEALTIPVPLTIVGNNYFFSNAGDGDGVQCRRGLAFQINVNRGQGLPPSLNQPPPPPYIEPPGPDAVQTPPSMVAVPPSGGASPTLANARVAIYGFAAALVLLRLR